MNIDEKIKNELEREDAALNTASSDSQGMFNMVVSAYQGGLGRWMILVTIVTLAVTALLFWSGYQFFTAASLSEQVHWGFCMLASLFIQVSLKQWTWMEMNRNSLLREIKRLELTVERLK